MLKYVLKRALWVVMGLVVFSFVAFSAGGLVSSYGGIFRWPEGGIEYPDDCAPGETFCVGMEPGVLVMFSCPTGKVSEESRAFFDDFGLDLPFVNRYMIWLRQIVIKGEWGFANEWQEPVRDLVGERALLTLAIVMSVAGIGWFTGGALGTLLARRKGALLADAVAGFCRVIAPIPSFLIALVVMWFVKSRFGVNAGGLFSQEYILAPWSGSKMVDLFRHIWLPVSLLLVGSVSQGTMVMRRTLLCELNAPYVDGARVRGVDEALLFKRYALRVGLGQVLDAAGNAMARIISSTVLVAMVLGLPTMGPLFLRALEAQDDYVIATILAVLVAVSIVSTAMVGVLRAALDPRLQTSA